MAMRAQDWLLQAERDLQQAAASKADARHEWACFAAHQASKKAVKAVHLSHGQEAWGHVVARLLSQLPPEAAAPVDLIERGRVLDNYYIPTRYPDSHADGAPFEHYGPLQSEEALQYARQILEVTRAQMAAG